jgi:hypothetical protein
LDDFLDFSLDVDEGRKDCLLSNYTHQVLLSDSHGTRSKARALLSQARVSMSKASLDAVALNLGGEKSMEESKAD